MFFHLVQTHILMLAVLIVVACADIDRSDIKVWGHNGDVTETSPGFPKPETADKLDKFSVIAAVKYCVISTTLVQFDQVVDHRTDTGGFKFPGALAANFLVLTEQNVAFGFYPGAA